MNMDCRGFHRDLEDYLEGSLDFAGRFGMEKHAERCFLCGKEMVDAGKLRAAACGLKRVAAPGDFEAAVLRRIQEEAHTRHPWGIWGWWNVGLGLLRPVAFAAAGMVLLAAGFIVAPHWDDPAQRAPVVRTPAPAKPRPTLASEAPARRTPEPTSQTVSAPEIRAQAPAPTRVVRTRPDAAATARPRTFTLQREWIPERVEAFDTDYVELLVPGPDNREILMRLPKTIRMESGQSSEEHFIRNVSH